MSDSLQLRQVRQRIYSAAIAAGVPEDRAIRLANEHVQRLLKQPR